MRQTSVIRCGNAEGKEDRDGEVIRCPELTCSLCYVTFLDQRTPKLLFEPWCCANKSFDEAKVEN
jgi:hypothetical protein